jgi:hypothetical protein
MLLVPNALCITFFPFEVCACNVLSVSVFLYFPLFVLYPLQPIPPFVCSSRAALDKVVSLPSAMMMLTFIFSFLFLVGGGRRFYITGLRSMCSVFSRFGGIYPSTISSPWFSATRHKIRHFASRSSRCLWCSYRSSWIPSPFSEITAVCSLGLYPLSAL